MPKNRYNLILVLIIFAGLFLRVWGIDFGLPHVFHQDEAMAINKAVSYGSGDFNPHNFQLPPLTSYILFIFYGLFYIIGLGFRFFTDTDSFLKLFIQEPTIFYIIARVLLGVLPGVFSVACVYKIARIIANKRAALLSAFFLSVAFIHVRNSHYAYHDIPLALCLILAFIYLFTYLDTGKIKDLFAAGVIAGIAAGFKYNGALIIIPVLILPWPCRKKPGMDKGLIIRYSLYFLSGFFIFCFLTNPYAVFDYKSFIQSLLFERQAHGFTGWFYHISYSCFEGIGVLMTLLSAFGLLLFLFSGDKRKQAIGLFVLLSYISIVFFGQKHERYILPMVPFLLVMAAFCVDKLLAGLMHKQQRVMAAAFLIVLLTAATTAKSVYSDILFTRPDTRAMAAEWIKQNIPEGEGIALDHSFFSPRLKQSVRQIEDKTAMLKRRGGSTARLKKAEILKKLAKESKAYNIFFLDDRDDDNFIFSSKPSIAFDMNDIFNNGIDYVVLHADYPGQPYPHEGFKEELLRNSRLLQEFNPYRDRRSYLDSEISVTSGPFRSKNIFARKRNGPVLFIYKIEVKRGHMR